MSRILIAFLLNLFFAGVEFAGGLLTGSTAILSDALHDMGDALSIGISWFMERKSKKKPDDRYTYGYGRYEVLGGFITTSVLLLGSVGVIIGAVKKLLSPTVIHYDGMILFAVIGLAVNLAAAWVTRDSASVNQKAVNLHMLEDVLGWAVVLAGAVVMRFTNLWFLDPLLSVGVAVFIFIHAIRNLKDIGDVFLEKIPEEMSMEKVKKSLETLDGVLDVHHIHLWSLDGRNICATMHIVANGDSHLIKDAVRQTLKKMGIFHTTLELEAETEHCHSRCCAPVQEALCDHHHHHHH